MLPLIVQVEKVSEHSAQTIAFDYSPVRIGRNPLNDISLGDAFVSLWHAVVRFDEHGTYYVDLGSRNGTTVDGRALRRNEEVRIDPGNDLRIGPLRLHLLRGDAPPELLNVPRATAFSLGAAVDAPEVARTAYVGQTAEDLVGLRNARAGLGPSASARPQSVSPPRPLPVSQATAWIISPNASSPPPRVGHEPAVPAPSTASTEALYADYRAAFSRLREDVQRQLQSLPAAERAEAVRGYRARFPALAHEPELAPLLGTPAAGDGGTLEIKAWLGRLTNGLYPPPMVKTDTAATMERLGAILEVFSQAFVELRRAQQDFCHEMALEQTHENTTLYKTEDPRVVLAYLLDPTSTGAVRVNELSRAFADFALHPVALVSGVTDGARALLELLGPQGLGAPDAQEGEGLVSRMLGGEARRLWSRFVTQHENLIEGDRFTRELFGREFARAYFRMTGGRISHVPGP